MLESFGKANKFQYQKLTEEEQSKRHILGRLVGIIANTKGATRNGRMYSAELWDKVFDNPIMKEKIANRVCLGELGHPADRTETDIEKVAICLAEVPKVGEDGMLYGVFDILDTPNGRILKTLCDYGSNIGVSSRGQGDVITDYDGNDAVDPDTYDCECWDAVLIPAVKEARLNLVTESLTKKKKTLKENLDEVLNNAKPEEKKVMLETLNSIGVDIVENNKKQLYKILFFKDEDDINKFNKDNLKVIDVNDNVFFVIGTAEDLSEVAGGTPDEIRDAVGKRMSRVALVNEDYTELEEGAAATAAATYVITHWDEIIKGIKDLGGAIDGVDENIVNMIKRHKDLKNEDFDQEELPHIKSVVKVLSNKLSGNGVLTDEEEKVFNAIKKCYNQEDCADKSVHEELAVENNEVGIVNELQETLQKKQDLESKLIELQEKLSVCYAKEAKLEEEINKKSNSIRKLSLDSKRANALQEKVSKLTSINEELNRKFSSVSEKVQKLEESAKVSRNARRTLTEDVNTKSSELTKLNEAYNQLNEKYAKEKESLNESIAELQKDLKMKCSEYSSKIEKSNKLVEKYKRIANNSVDKYIDSQALKLGITSNEIKNRLPESYTFDDIDAICEDLQDYKLTMSKLPFQMNENVRLKATAPKKENLIPANDSDVVDESLLRLAGLNK